MCFASKFKLPETILIKNCYHGGPDESAPTLTLFLIAIHRKWPGVQLQNKSTDAGIFIQWNITQA